MDHVMTFNLSRAFAVVAASLTDEGVKEAAQALREIAGDESDRKFFESSARAVEQLALDRARAGV